MKSTREHLLISHCTNSSRPTLPKIMNQHFFWVRSLDGFPRSLIGKYTFLPTDGPVRTFLGPRKGFLGRRSPLHVLRSQCVVLDLITQRYPRAQKLDICSSHKTEVLRSGRPCIARAVWARSASPSPSWTYVRPANFARTPPCPEGQRRLPDPSSASDIIHRFCSVLSSACPCDTWCLVLLPQWPHFFHLTVVLFQSVSLHANLSGATDACTPLQADNHHSTKTFQMSVKCSSTLRSPHSHTSPAKRRRSQRVSFSTIL